MLVELKKSDLITETEDNVASLQVINKTGMYTIDKLKLHSYTGFNRNIASRILLEGSKNFKYFKFEDVDGVQSHMCSIPYIKKNAFIFDYLKALGIALTELNIDFSVKDGVFTMKVHNKIYKILTVASEDMKANLTFFLYCICKLISIISTSSNPIVTDAEGNTLVPEELLNTLYSRFNNMEEKVIVDIGVETTSKDFKTVTYHANNIEVNSVLNYKSSCEFVYNTLNTDKQSILIITNKSFKEYYMYDIAGNKIYTTAVLQKYNTLDFSEWIPHYVKSIFTVRTVKNIVVEHIDFKMLSSVLLKCDKGTEYVMDVLTYDYDSLLNTLNCNCSENYDLKLYNNLIDDIKLKSNTASSDLSEEYKDDEYAQQLYKQVQDYYESFDLKDLATTIRGVATGEIYSMLFIGESGTGKSTAAKVIPYKCGLPYVVINCSTNIEEADMFGAMIPNPKKIKAEDPEFVWQDGVLTKAIRNGYCAVIEELNFARPGVLGKLNSLLDESRQIDLSNGEIVKAHKNFRLIVTCNIGYEGTNRLNKALINRFEVCKQFTDLNKSETIEVIKNRTGYTDVGKINSIYDVYFAIKKYSNEQNLGIVISIRQLLNIFKQGKYYKNAYDAVCNTLLNTAFLEDADHLEYFKETILSAFNLNFKL